MTRSPLALVERVSDTNGLMIQGFTFPEPELARQALETENLPHLPRLELYVEDEEEDASPRAKDQTEQTPVQAVLEILKQAHLVGEVTIQEQPDICRFRSNSCQWIQRDLRSLPMSGLRNMLGLKMCPSPYLTTFPCLRKAEVERTQNGMDFYLIKRVRPKSIKKRSGLPSVRRFRQLEERQGLERLLVDQSLNSLYIVIIKRTQLKTLAHLLPTIFKTMNVPVSRQG